jgi:DNA helicase II / ATP-dependent DNA helicase PcrA
MNPAEAASERALTQVYACLDNRESFRLEAGAGAGKTYSLVKALQYLIRRDKYALPKRHQHIACITFTNVAKDEIESRTDRSPMVYCGTIHAFCWSLIGSFQKQIRDRLPAMEPWPKKIAESGDLGEKPVEYSLGHRSIRDDHVSIHHDDVLALTVHFMGNAKFRGVLKAKYPIVLIDEYQDTNAPWIESIKNQFLGTPASPQFGFFGDHWQKIYGDGCGRVEHPSLKVIGKEANFRSVTTIVECLNRMRPELPQCVVDPEDRGSVSVFHTNNWVGVRQTGQHWGGDVPSAQADAALQQVIDILTGQGWDLSPATTKILMLTHRSLASKQGYSSLPGVFAFNDSFTKKEDPHIAFFADTLEPACEAFASHRYGDMFQVLGGHRPLIRGHADKDRWTTAMRRVLELRTSGTVGQILDHLRRAQRPRLPDAVERRERELEQFDRAGAEEMPRALTELEALRAVSYKEIVALCQYLSGHSPFETKHGVKGAEFENVLVVVGRGWNQYNFNEMLELAEKVDRIPTTKRAAFERNRNLFYVTCSRPKRRLAILFTQKLSDLALRTLGGWFGAGAIRALNI